MTLALDIRQLVKKYSGFEALNKLSFQVQAGQCMGLLGSNGAGKSTTIRIITGQLKPNQGEALVFGFNPSLEPKKIHALIGYIPDSQSLYDELTVFDNIDLFRQLYGVSKNKTYEVIEKLNLTEKIKEKTKALSKGLRQRVLIARALVHGPQLIILDEPTTGLDPSSAESIYLILEELKKTGSTILLTTHLMNDVERLCDQIIFIDKGQKIEEGTPLELKRKFSENTVDVVVSEEGQYKNYKIKKGPDWLEELKQLQALGEIIKINSHEPKLEDIFIRLLSEKK